MTDESLPVDQTERIERMLRTSLDAIEAPLSPDIPATADGSQQPPFSQHQSSDGRCFFTECDFEKYSQKSIEFLRSWGGEVDSPLLLLAPKLTPPTEPPPPPQYRATDSSIASPALARGVTTTMRADGKPPEAPVPAEKERSASLSPASMQRAMPLSDMDVAALAAGAPIVRPPRLSSLSPEEHALFLECQKKIAEARRMGIAVQPLTPAELPVYMDLQARVAKEQEEYNQYVMKEIMANKAAYFIYHQDVAAQIEKVLARRRERVKSYPRFYEFSSILDLTPVKGAPGDPVLKHAQTVLQLGHVLNAESPEPTDIRLNIEVFGPGPQGRWTKKTMPVVSEDPAIEPLVLSHRTDVVLSSAALVALVDNHAPHFGEAWQIPVKIVERQVPKRPNGMPDLLCDESKRGEALRKQSTKTRIQTIEPAAPLLKTVYVDKPFVRKRMTPREKNELYYKTAFESLVLRPASKGIVFAASAKPAQTKAAATPGSADGPSEPPPEAREEAEKGKAQTAPLEDDNLTYNVWKFDDMRLLVRCKIHGVLDPNPSGKVPPYRFVGVKVKLEYQPRLGWEEVTMGETARWWIYTFMRPDAHLLLGRINPFESKLVNVEHKDMLGILPPSSQFKPVNSSKILLVVLRKLRSLPPGQYLISHKPKDCNVVFYKSVERPSAANGTGAEQAESLYDLHSDLADAGASDTDTVPFVLPRWSAQPNQIPYTFPLASGAAHLSKHYVPPPPKYKKLRYCHAFAHGICRAGAECKFPHLTEADLEEELKRQGRPEGPVAAAGLQAGKKKKKKKKKGKREDEMGDAGAEESTDEAAHPPPPPEAPQRKEKRPFWDWDSAPSQSADMDFEAALALHRQSRAKTEPPNGHSSASLGRATHLPTSK